MDIDGVRPKGSDLEGADEHDHRIVFAGYATWEVTAGCGSQRRLVEEYATMLTLAPAGTALVLARAPAMVGVEYHGLFAMRGRLSTVGEVNRWVSLSVAGASRIGWSESGAGQLALAFAKTQAYFGDVQMEVAGGKLCPTEGDEKAHLLLAQLSESERHGGQFGCWIDFITQKVRVIREEVMAKEPEKEVREKERGQEQQVGMMRLAIRVASG